MFINNNLLQSFLFSDIPRRIEELHNVNIDNNINDKFVILYNAATKKYEAGPITSANGGGTIFVNNNDTSADYLINKILLDKGLQLEIIDNSGYKKLKFKLNLHESLEFTTDNKLQLATQYQQDISDLNNYSVESSAAIVELQERYIKIVKEIEDLDNLLNISKNEDWSINSIERIDNIESNFNTFKNDQLVVNTNLQTQINDLASRVSALEG